MSNKYPTINNVLSMSNDQTKVEVGEETNIIVFLTDKLVATGHKSKSMRLWNYPSFSLNCILTCYENITDIKPFQNVPLVAVYSLDNNNAQVWNYLTCEIVWDSSNTEFTFGNIVCCAEVDILCSLDYYSLHLWNVHSNEHEVFATQNHISYIINAHHIQGTKIIRQEYYYDHCDSTLLEMWDIANFQPKKLWSYTYEFYSDGICVSNRDTILVNTNNNHDPKNYILELSFKGVQLKHVYFNANELLKRVIPLSKELLLTYNSKDMRLINIDEDRSTKIGPKWKQYKYVAVHPKKKVVIIASKKSCDFIVHRLMPDSHDEERMFTLIPACKFYFDISITTSRD
jgi:hypothetical protein